MSLITYNLFKNQYIVDNFLLIILIYNLFFMYWISDANAHEITPLKKTYDIEGENITFESGKLGLLINWAVTISDENDNVLFVTTWVKTEWLNEQADFFPLVVEFQEKYYATWKIAWSRFRKREWRANDEATLMARIIDRPIRPMFPKWIINEVQIIATVLSATWEKELGFWWITWASLGLMIAWTPFEWPVAGCKLSLTKEGKYIFNPTTKQEEEARLNLLTAWTKDAITMVEAGAQEVSDEEMLMALEKSHEIIKKICKFQEDFVEEYKKEFSIEKIEMTFNKPDETLYEEVRWFLTEEKLEVLYNKWKKEFQLNLDMLDIETKEFLISKWHNLWDKTDEEENIIAESSIWALVYKRVKEVMRKNVLEKEKRLDGRALDEVRPVFAETWLLARTHGSALFQRWLTQAVSITTLGWPDDTQVLDWMMPESEKRYMHHYNFPPYSVWEVRMLRWVGRREIWHGALAERALIPVLPSLEEFPYTIRVVSEIMTCNGSSSMASICGSTMSLMNAWVPIKAPVWGVAMWMIYDEETWKYKILSDIQAQEDFLWDMDFKVWRTKKWITTMQLDVKIKWLKMQVFRDAFAQSSWAVDYILEKMLEAQAEVSKNLSPYAPLILNIQVPVDKIAAVIGRGWENVQRMEKELEVKISIEEDWNTTITASSQENWEKVISQIKEILWEPKVWYKWVWKVEKIIEWVWAIVAFRGKSGMIHISKLALKRVANVQDIVKVWDEVEFEILQVDMAKWRIWLARIPTEAEKKEYKEYLEKKEKEHKEYLAKKEAETKKKEEK